MSAAPLLDCLHALGVVLAADDDDLVVEGSDEALTDEVLAELASRKAEVLALLAPPPEPGWVAWARSLPTPEWDAWRARAKAIEASLPRPGTIAAIKASMAAAWREMVAPAPVGATP